MTRVARFEIDLALAQAMVEAAITAATSADALVSVAVVDAGGHLVAFAREFARKKYD